MATLRKKRKLAVLNKENHNESSRSNQSQYTTVTRIHDDYITQLAEETENKVRRKLFQEFSETESRILSALSKLDDFFMNPQVQARSGPVLETSRN